MRSARGDVQKNYVYYIEHRWYYCAGIHLDLFLETIIYEKNGNYYKQLFLCFARIAVKIKPNVMRMHIF